MPHILVIEDYRDNREVAKLILNDAGYHVTTAADGLRGVQMAIQCHPDLVLMDLALPWLNGWEATQRLKATPTTCSIPVVAFTAHVLPDDLPRARAAGCSAVIAKPFEIDTLLTEIATLLAPATERECSPGKLPGDT
jgi:two-component system, cell cycle response regulator DivK